MRTAKKNAPAKKAAAGKPAPAQQPTGGAHTIEEEIRQTHFRTSGEKAFINLVFTANYLNSKLSVFLRQYDGLTPQQYNILRILRGQKGNPISILEVKNRMLDRQPDASRIIDRMVRKGLISRTASRTDRRQVDLAITKAGLKLLDSVGDKHLALFRALFNMSEAELEKFSLMLDSIRAD
jgi:DNA-binding MarR family transcriptional regulator